MNLIKVGISILENERLILRPLSLEDFDLLLHFSENEPEIWKFSLVNAAGSSALKNYLKTAVQSCENGSQIPYIVFDKKMDTVVGCTRLYDIEQAQQRAKLGYTWYGKEYQGTGINVNCKYLLLEYAFETLKLERIQFMADSRNSRSLAAMKKIGCIEEGILRKDFMTTDGIRRDSAVLSILKSEWEQKIKNHLTSLIINTTPNV